MRGKPLSGRPGRAGAERPRGKGIPPALFYGLFALLCSTNAATLVGFLMSPDIAALLSGQNDRVLTAYEDRIAQLRVEVDRLHSRSYAQAGDVNLQLQELAQQQEILSEQHQYVRTLAEKAAALGIGPAPQDDPGVDPIVTGKLPAGGSSLTETSAQVDTMMSETRQALAALSDAATTSTNEILAELREIGIRPALPAADVAMGGPYLPVNDGPEADSMVDDANAVAAALARFKAARDAIDAAPVHRPMDGTVRLSSTYGNRKDPFTGRRAFHAGIDFPAPSGTTVLSAGDGTVSFVGQRSGYGNVVEVTHAGGLLTRYAHLSAVLVKEGQAVKTGMPIAQVGSTGRSTGPHLHFEVRKDDAPMNPAGFLEAGRRLQRFLQTA